MVEITKSRVARVYLIPLPSPAVELKLHGRLVNCCAQTFTQFYVEMISLPDAEYVAPVVRAWYSPLPALLHLLVNQVRCMFWHKVDTCGRKGRPL